MTVRLINASRSQIEKMTAADLKESIWKSEGRVVMAQNAPMMHSMLSSVTNPELSQAMGADMVMINTYWCKEDHPMPGLQRGSLGLKTGGGRIPDILPYVDVPLGVYLECGGRGTDLSNGAFGEEYYRYRMATRENLELIAKEGAKFIVLGGNPGTSVKYDTIIEGIRLAKEVLGDRMLIMAGKWEDGAGEEPILGDPMKPQEYYKDIIAKMIDAGADCICMSMPGCRWGINVDCIRDLVTFVHTYKRGTLALSFLDGTIEGADVDTVRACALMSKETGADIHAIGDAGFNGMSVPENIYQLAITTKGRSKTWERMAGSRR